MTPQHSDWKTCPSCHQMSAVPAHGERRSFECLDCGHVWVEREQDQKPRGDASATATSDPKRRTLKSR